MAIHVKNLKTALKYRKNMGKPDWSLPYIIQKIQSLEKRIKSDEAWIAGALSKISELKKYKLKRG